MKFFLVLPGETENGAGNGSQPLSETGRRQAAAVAAELCALAARGERHAAVLASPLASAQETATTIAEALGLPPPELRDELSAPGSETLPAGNGVEALEAAQERGWALIEEFKQRLEMNQTLVLVTEELTIRALICRALSMPLTEMRRFRLDPGSLSVIEYRLQPRERTLLAGLNETCHLETPA